MRTVPAGKKAITTIDAYLSALTPDKRAALAKLRQDILKAAPGATECISYGMPGFKLDGRMLAWMGAATHHCAFYPGAIVETFKADLKRYETSKGTIRFAPDDPLPATLVKKLVKAVIARNTARQLRTKKGAASRR